MGASQTWRSGKGRAPETFGHDCLFRISKPTLKKTPFSRHHSTKSGKFTVFFPCNEGDLNTTTEPFAPRDRDSFNATKVSFSKSLRFIRKCLVLLLRLECRLTMAPRCKRIPSQGRHFLDAHLFCQGIARYAPSFRRSNECLIQELLFCTYKCHILYSI